MENTVKHVNIKGKNNDMIDGFEKIIDHIISSDDLKLLVQNEITKLRSTINNSEINWTQNEQDELKKLLFNVLNNGEVTPEQKAKLLVEILEIKIKNELKELPKQSLKETSEIISQVKLNTQINEFGKIIDSYEGKSNYVVILLPIEHINYFLEDSSLIQEETIYRLINQNFNITGIINALVQEGITNAYGFEGGDFQEISSELPYGIEKKYNQKFERYIELLNSPNENNKELGNLERELVYLGAFHVYPEFLHNDKLLTYGIENIHNFHLLVDTKEILSFLILQEKKNINISKQINIFLNIKSKEYKGKTKFNNYLPLLENTLKIKGYENIKLDKYLHEIIKIHIYFKHKKRNIDIVKNIETLYENATPNGIIIKLGSSHFGKPEKSGLPEVDNEIIPSLEIKNIKELLKEKLISFIEITPNS